MRLHPMMLKEKHLAPDVIDELVLDCTFCSHAHSSFPSKEESVALFVELIKKHPSEQVFIELDMLGTEMFVSALQRFAMRSKFIAFLRSDDKSSRFSDLAEKS